MGFQTNLLSLYCGFIFLSCFLGGVFGDELRREAMEKRLKRDNHRKVVQVSSLLPSSECNSPAQDTRGSSLQVVHRYGPCYKHGQDDSYSLDAANAPVRSGLDIDSNAYVVTVGLGTPKTDLSLFFDTTSGLTWTQCKPCKTCYKQKYPIFSPTNSSTYFDVPCDSPTCDKLDTGYPQQCEVGCVYMVQYLDDSFSVGRLGVDTVTLGSDSIDGFNFVCGQENRGIYGTEAGILGLSQSVISIVSQTALVYGQYFSYCLPSTSSLTGHLTFGNDSEVPKSLEFTPMWLPNKEKYYINTIGISVDGILLPIPPSVLAKTTTVLHSRTLISKLHPNIYVAMRDAFRRGMSQYPLAPSYEILDTCYDLSGIKEVIIPKITIFLRDFVKIPLDVSGTVIVVEGSNTTCLAFAPTNDDSVPMVFGTVQQRTYEIVFDIPGQRIGFGQGGCG